jgi:hypothetical protein
VPKNLITRQFFPMSVARFISKGERLLAAQTGHTHAESSRLESRTPASSTIVEVPTSRCWRLAAGHPRQQITHAGGSAEIAA